MDTWRHNTPDAVRDLWGALNAEGATYLVGGYVRDMLAGREPKDIDLATALSPERVSEIARGLGLRVIPTSLTFGTVTVLTPEPIEVTTFRRDGRYGDGRHPDVVSFADTIEEDLSRRDFRINAIAVGFDGSIIDPFDGCADIEYGILRTVGNPSERFKEDPLRMWRAVRFVAEGKTNYCATEVTAAIRRHRYLTVNLSRERVRDELSRILTSPQSWYGLPLLLHTGLIQLAIPELSATMDFDQRNRHHAYSLELHTYWTVGGVPPTLELRLAALLHDIAKPQCVVNEGDGQFHYYGHEVLGAKMTEEILKRLRYPNVVVEHVTTLVRHHMFAFDDAGPKAYRRLLANVGRDTAEDLLTLHTADASASGTRADRNTSPYARSMLDLATAETDILRLAITGHDVMHALGIGPGQRVGEVLSQCRELVLDDPACNNRQYLLAVVTSI